MLKKKYELEEKPLFNVVTVYRQRGNYLQRLEQFEKAIQAYNEALRWNCVRSIRSTTNKPLDEATAMDVYASTLPTDYSKPLIHPTKKTYRKLSSLRVNDTKSKGKFSSKIFKQKSQRGVGLIAWVLKESDVHSLLGRSLARAKATHYVGALADADLAAEVAPENLTALQIRAKTEYEKCEFERSLVLAVRGQKMRRTPADFADCARVAEQTIRECVDETATKVLSQVPFLLRKLDLKVDDDYDQYAPIVIQHKSRMQPETTHQYKVQEMTFKQKQRKDHMARLMASKYLERMAHDKHFLRALCKDERLPSANKQDSKKLQLLANKAYWDLEKRQSVLRERRPLYSACAPEEAARARLAKTRKQQISRAQNQLITDAKRLIKAAQAMYEKRDTAKCLENAEFAMEQLSRKSANLLPGKDKFLQELYDIVAEAFLDQKRVKKDMSESDREKRAFVLLGIPMSREPSRDSVLRVRPPAPPRDTKRRLRRLERALMLGARASERCYVLHELARLHLDIKQLAKARYYAAKCQSEARSSDQPIWLLNAIFMLAKCHVQFNNRPEARSALIEGANLANSYKISDVAEFFDTCVNISMEGETDAGDFTVEKREKEMVSLMQDSDLKAAAEQLFRRMSVIPTARRFSVLPGTKIDDSAPPATRRMSIIPQSQRPTRIAQKKNLPLGYQEFEF